MDSIKRSQPDKRILSPVHPTYGELDAWILIELSNQSRSLLESQLRNIQLSNAEIIVEADAALAISCIIDYDREFITDLNILHDVEYMWLVKQILDTHHEMEIEFKTHLLDCIEEIEAIWEQHKMIGDNSAKDLYKRLEENYNRGWLAPDIAEKFLEERAMKSRIFRDAAFKPHPIIKTVWDVFNILRRSTNGDYNIGFDSFVYYSQSTGIQLSPLQIDSVMLLDNKFLVSRDKSRK